MAQILEATMLICFGLSWPVNLYKNAKARSAKNMSLPFIILILLGYAAGITAKLVSGAINYVLIFYIFNIITVTMNLVVYFINARHDRMAAQNGAACQAEEAPR